jgi:hypothetical protein
MRFLDPGCDRLASLIGDFELNWPVRLVLNDHGAAGPHCLGRYPKRAGLPSQTLSLNGTFWTTSLPLFQGTDFLEFSVWEFIIVSFNKRTPMLVRQTDAQRP